MEVYPFMNIYEYKLIGRATRASQLALGPLTLACITKNIFVQHIIHNNMNTSQFIYSEMLILAKRMFATIS